MWNKNTDGSVLWSEAAKLKLVDLLKENIDAIGNDRLNPRKPTAWKKVYESLLRAGMPRTSIDRVKKCWARMSMAARSQRNNRSNVRLSKLDNAVINLLNGVNNDTNVIQNDMPKPMVVIKKEPPTDEEANRPKRIRLSQIDMNPVVRLNRIETTSDPKTEYYNLMKKVAENEWKLKLAQREHEEERMENERELHHKTLILMELKIKVQQLQIDALRGQDHL